ncbi:MAG: indole-3-glycerol phosphate synthase TrpC [Eubacterium sp.]|mgnify:FL=1|nr:indole-3-glycerol phosphate synthase TrpC [Eubacterium sp.]
MILDEITAATKKRVEICKQRISLEEMKRNACSLPVEDKFPFEIPLRGEKAAFICEIKKASPSKGIIAEDFPYLNIAREYEEAGADSISVLTEPDFFMGSTKYLEEIHRKVNTPLLRKDFTIDEYMIYEAKVIGASAVLLICSLLSEAVLGEWIELCESLGLSALVEAHDEEEIRRAVRAGARIIGVNNRDLKTFQVDIKNCLRLREKIPKNILFVAESGIRTREDIKALEQGGVNGVLIGETLMRSVDKKKTLAKLRGMDVSK